MRTFIRPACMTLLILTLITGVIYPLVITGVGQLVFPAQANGSLVVSGGQPVGSSLIGQKFTELKYFWPRPSAIDYQPMPSSGSNLGPTSQALQQQVQQRENELRQLYGLAAGSDLPADLLFASGSGLDPHISPAAAQLQIGRVAQARNLPEQKVADLVAQHIEPAQFGLLGGQRVNVLLLNLALDGLK